MYKNCDGFLIFSYKKHIIVVINLSCLCNEMFLQIVLFIFIVVTINYSLYSRRNKATLELKPIVPRDSVVWKRMCRKKGGIHVSLKIINKSLQFFYLV